MHFRPNCLIFDCQHILTFRFLDQQNLQTRPLSETSTPSTSTMDGRNRVSEIEGFDSSRMRNFPFSSFKLLGWLQIGIGGLCLLLGVIDLFLYLYVSNYDNQTLSALTISSVPVWCGLWVSFQVYKRINVKV